MTRHGSFAALLCALAVAGCGDKIDRTVTGPAPAAKIKFFNFGMSTPQVNFYGDGVKLTAISSATGTESTIGTAYGAAAGGGLYVGVTPGQHTFTGRISGATDKGLAISTVTQTIENGKSYSYYQSGFYNTTTKTVDAFVIEDPFAVPADTMARVRFVNASPNAGNIQFIVKSQATGSTEVAIETPQGYKGASAFAVIPPGVYDVSARSTVGTPVITFTLQGVSLGRAHVYTASLRGDWTVTSTTAATRPQLDVTANF